MIRKMRVALNQAFVHGKQACIVKRNVALIDGLCILGLRLAVISSPIGTVPAKTWHDVYIELNIIFLSIK